MVAIDNFEVDKGRNIVLISVNPRVYPLNVIFSASYLIMNQAFAIIDGDPESEIVVSLRPRKGQKLEELARNFNDQLLNYAVNNAESKKTEKLREELVKDAFAGHSQSD